MARLYMAGAETGHIHSEAITNVGTVPVFDTTVKRSGTYSFKIDGGAGGTVNQLMSYPFTSVIDTSYFLSVWFYIPSGSGYPTTAFGCVRFVNTSSSTLSEIRLQTSGVLQLYRSTTAIGSPTAALSMDTWHRIDLMTEVGTGATDIFTGRLNGTQFATASAVNHGDVLIGFARWGSPAAPGVNKVYYYDDVILNDDTGSVNATYPGDDKVVLLLPTADSARDAGWLAGAGATTNLYDANNNLPPVGVVLASATNAGQIKNAVSTTTEAYSATMQTYTAAGIASGDTITAIHAVAELGTSTAAAVTTGVQVTSNPAIAEATPSTAAAIAGTYPSNWTRGVTAIAENPTVTKGTAPVMRVRKNTAATTSTMACLMGMTVSYTVGAAPSGTRLRFILSLLLLLRDWLLALWRWLGRILWHARSVSVSAPL